ncbi:diphosphomevalonate decarboxylase, partial [Paragonimus westermani]
DNNRVCHSFMIQNGCPGDRSDQYCHYQILPQNKLPGRMKDVIIAGTCLTSILQCFLRSAQLRARLLRPDPIHPYVCIESVNNFPTAAGLASSASGIAALAFGLAKLYGLSDDLPGLARRGSGSASRSLAGGFVHWCATGANPPIQANSSVIELYPASYWPTLRVLICVVAYTYDAGPNAILLAEETDVPFILRLLVFCFGSTKSTPIKPGCSMLTSTELGQPLKELSFSGIQYDTFSQSIVAVRFHVCLSCLLFWLIFVISHYGRTHHREVLIISLSESTRVIVLLCYKAPLKPLLDSLPRYEGGILQVISTQVSWFFFLKIDVLGVYRLDHTLRSGMSLVQRIGCRCRN